MKLVITMSRRFGTGASIIATELSKRLDIPVYDKAYIEEQLNDRMYESEAEAIRKLAEHPCIILGRCASDILKDKMNVLNIFVCADKEDRIRRIMDGIFRKCILTSCPCCFTPLLVKVRRTGKMQKNLTGSIGNKNVV